MSHVFISYSHQDEKYRDLLITELQKEGIDYWADTGLEVGEVWREQIDDNLKSAFALAVIVTNQSLQSFYVTYEWSWALGHEIPVIPLFFEEITVHIHSKLDSIQRLKCYTVIPHEVFETIKRYQKLSPLIIYIEILVSEMMMPLRYAVRTMIWLFSFDENESTIELYTAISIIRSLLILELNELNRNKLPQLWLQNSHSFPRDQKRKIQRLTEQIDNFSSYRPPTSDPYDREVGKTIISLWKEKIEPILQELIGYENSSFTKFNEDLEFMTTSGLQIYDDKTRARARIVAFLLEGKQHDKFFHALSDLFNNLSREPISESDFNNNDN